MSKLRLAVRTLVVVVILAAAVAVAIAKQQDRKDVPPTRPEFTVAAASTGETASVVGPRVAVPLRVRALGPLPETFTLVAVGGLLLGLAAAVRRTT